MNIVEIWTRVFNIFLLQRIRLGRTPHFLELILVNN